MYINLPVTAIVTLPHLRNEDRCIYIYIYIYIYIFNNRTRLEYNKIGKVSRTTYVFHITICFSINYTFINGLN